MNLTWTAEGREFDLQDPAPLLGFLRGRSLLRIPCTPDRLLIRNDGQKLYVRTAEGATREFPIRRSFLLKILRWHSFPLPQLERLTIDTVTGLLNDYILSIRGPVTLTVEDGEALTLTGERYRRIGDEEVLAFCEPLGIARIWRNDFALRVSLRSALLREVAPGDCCGFGVNVFNSETGFSALRVAHFILRLVCTNGAVVEIRAGGGKRVHLGGGPGGLAVWLALRLNLARGEREKLVEALLAARASSGVEKARELRPTLRTLLGSARASRLLSALDGTASVYDLFNALTSEARAHGGALRLRLETLAGGLLGV
ncbi:MAG: hypothetical protein WB626_00025 [Bacteroidota bacterium]